VKKRVIMVSATHWDREHARPVEQFRWHLVYNVMDEVVRLLDDGTLPVFVLDGQVSPVEDYLAVRPDREADIQRLVQQGKLIIGPLFITPDEMLPSGECLVRNLLLGRRMCERFGPTMQVGHNHDTFGRCAQMPQILRGFGIRRALHHRGGGEDVPGWGAPFRWRAPDGSEVLAVMHVLHTTADLPDSADAAVQILRQSVAANDPCDLPIVLIGNGGDGAPPRPRLAQAAEWFNATCDDMEMHIGTLDEYFGALEALDGHEWPLVEGELHSSRHAIILSGVASARGYIKQADLEAERALLRHAEPLCTLAWVLTGDPYPREFIKRALHSILENQFHDTICGCSGDEVYRDAVRRYAHAKQIAQVLIERATKRLAQRLNTAPPEPGAVPVLAFNPHAAISAEPTIAHLYLPADHEALQPFHVVDAAGRPVPSQVLYQSVDPPHQPYFWRRFLPHDQPVRELQIAFRPELPPLGCAAYFVAPRDAPGQTDLSVDERGLENEFLRVEIALDGTVSLTDKRTGQTFTGLNRFEDEESLCGEYYHITSPTPHVETPPPPGRLSVTATGPLRATVRLEYEWSLPASARDDLQGRSAERVTCPLVADVSLWSGVPRVEFRVTFDNRVRDHRLRVVFPTALHADNLAVETPFAVVNRAIDLPDATGWADPPVHESAMHSFTDLSDGEKGLAVLSRGLREVAAEQTSGGTQVALTLLRAVGWIARLHPGVRGYRIPTPDAQCLGEHTFEYALYRHAGDWREGRVWEQAHRYVLPPAAFDVEPSPGDTGDVSLLSVAPSELVLSAAKQAEDGSGVVVRLWNVSGETIEGQLTFGLPIAEAWRISLAEEPIKQLDVAGNTVALSVGPHEVVTLLSLA
jgi:mannosylglycerate hydrolase